MFIPRKKNALGSKRGRVYEWRYCVVEWTWFMLAIWRILWIIALIIWRLPTHTHTRYYYYFWAKVHVHVMQSSFLRLSFSVCLMISVFFRMMMMMKKRVGCDCILRSISVCNYASESSSSKRRRRRRWSSWKHEIIKSKM